MFENLLKNRPQEKSQRELDLEVEKRALGLGFRFGNRVIVQRSPEGRAEIDREGRVDLHKTVGKLENDWEIVGFFSKNGKELVRVAKNDQGKTLTKNVELNELAILNFSKVPEN